MPKVFIFKILLVPTVLFLATSVLAAGECGPRPDESGVTSWHEYRCQGTGCSGDVLHRECQETCTRDCECVEVDENWSWDCTDWDCSTTCGEEDTAQNCQSWQICQGNTSWENIQPSCQCSASCLEQPSGSFPENGVENVKLPITFMWNAVNGAQSYHYEISGITDGAVDTSYVLIDNCQLQSNENYEWQVQACCDSSCINSGPWSDTWSFNTSLAPELLLPENNATSTSIPTMFDWCDTEEAESYYLNVYKEGETEVYFPYPILKEGGVLPSEFIEDIGFLSGITYLWEVATCKNEGGIECDDWSQKWKFMASTDFPAPTLIFPVYNPANPENIPAVNLLDRLRWEFTERAFSYRYRILDKNREEIINSSSSVSNVSFDVFWQDNLELNETYSWQVEFCWDDKGENCDEENWSEEWRFKTTGAPPTNPREEPINNEEKVLIPAKLIWDEAPGAASYYFDGSFEPSGVINKAEVSLSHPDLVPETDYWWRVKTCADKNGEFCGQWSETKNFTTAKISTPINPLPEDGGTLETIQRYLRWDEVSGANFYQYKIDYQGEEKIPLTIISANYITLPVRELDLGDYAWWVQACLDKECRETGEWAGPWQFTLVEVGGATEKGIVPCDRSYDDPRTPWNERESCQIKHVFIMAKNIIDFVLWRLGLIVLALLTLATRVVYYFSTGAPQTMVKVKTIWKSAGVGYAIIFVGWIIINTLLIILGYQWETFGDWWQITF